jgi:peptidoglycan/xylan/chitin deacetylase (PgdA/CDA1 family)
MHAGPRDAKQPDWFVMTGDSDNDCSQISATPQISQHAKPVSEMRKKELLASILERTGAGTLLRSAPTWQGLLVLNYHRVGPWPTTVWDKDLFSTTQEGFRDQLKFLKANFDVVGFDEVASVANKRGRHVQITFDDGYRDNHDLAFPVLTDLGLSATFFICTGFIDKARVPWWDELAWIVNHAQTRNRATFRGLELSLGDAQQKLAAARRLNALYDRIGESERASFLDELSQAISSKRCTPVDGASLWMSWDMIRTLHRGGMTIGGHTLTHIELSRFSESEQLVEIKGSCQRIEAEIGAPVRAFSYPYGTPHSFNSSTRIALTDAGIEYAYSYGGGYQGRTGWDRYDLKRTPVEAHHSDALFRSMVSVPRLFA